jgi:hypothetical protein
MATRFCGAFHDAQVRLASFYANFAGHLGGWYTAADMHDFLASLSSSVSYESLTTLFIDTSTRLSDVMALNVSTDKMARVQILLQFHNLTSISILVSSWI